MQIASKRAVRSIAALALVMLAVGHQPVEGEGRTRRPHVTLNVKSSPTSFRPEMGFAEAVNILRHATSPPVNIVVLWQDLDGNAGIDRETAIGMDGVRGVPMRTHLELLLTAVAADNPVKLRYRVQGGVIVIGTEEGLRPRQATRLYRVADITSPPANYWFPSLGVLNASFPTGLHSAAIPLGINGVVR